MSKEWMLRSSEVCELVGTDPKKGLGLAFAKKRLNQVGPNRLPKRGGSVWWKILLSQFSSLIIWLLIIASLVAFFLGEVIDSMAIIAIIILNAVLGFFQEFRAEHSLEALQKLASPRAKVIRDGVLQVIDAETLVPGDLLLLEAGDRIPADGRLIHVAHLKTQEAHLTGESTPIEKTDQALRGDPPLSGRKNMGYMGTVAVSGKAHLVVTKTGVETEIGKIAANLLGAVKEQTPLQKQLNRLGKKLVTICLGIVVIVFGLGLLRGSGFIEMILISLSLAVAAMPEGLPAAVTISLAIGVRKMVEKRALIRRLSSVETLGCTSVICTDKTGTLTQNEMTVRSLWTDGEFFDVTGSGYAPRGTFERGGRAIDPQKNENLIWALKIALLCNNANIVEREGGWEVVGDPTEGALLTLAEKAGLKKEEEAKAFPLRDELPFDSDRKMMSMLRDETLFAKGALSAILKKTTHILYQGKEIPLKETLKEEIINANQAFASKAQRVLALAYRENPYEPYEEKFVFVALIGMMDPPRAEVADALERCREAGISAVMVTGDHKQTATAIGKELSMIPPDSRIIDGRELDQMSEEDLDREIEKISIFSRITAAHKLRIVKAYKRKMRVTAMTGDGVNDAPAVQAADIGISMGITGTDVTKEASDMVILDDNFASIVNAVEEGRGIYDNIVKFVSYLLSSNIAEILVIFLSMLLGFKGPGGQPFVALLPVQLLWMNLVTDGLPAISLAMDPVDKRVMKRAPRKVTEGILTMRFTLFLLSISCLVTLGTLIACFYGLRTSVALAQTMTFTTLIVLELVRAQMIRQQYRLSLFSNGYLLAALLSSFLLQLVVLYVPFLQSIFGTVAIGWLEWSVIFAMGFATWWLGLLITKLFYRDS